MVSGQLSGMRACDARACGLNSCCVRRVLHACPGAASCIVTRGRGRRRWPRSLCEGPAPARAEGPGPATTPHLGPTLAGPLAFRGRAPGFEITPVVLRGDVGTWGRRQESGEERRPGAWFVRPRSEGGVSVTAPCVRALSALRRVLLLTYCNLLEGNFL